MIAAGVLYVRQKIMKASRYKVVSYVFAAVLAICTSILAAFFLFAIAFNTSWDKLRGEFMPVYFGMIIGVIISTLILPRWVYFISFVALSLPVLVLCFIAFQNASFLIDLVLIVAFCSCWSWLLNITNQAEQVAAPDS
ncbi:hypothetical protein HW115_18695 [Verrucomicrobiaceae bacterium N1E253]|uniref:Uncharacterized protein n=1 Tax=Oceaniferula marina TaxID=2748318 RepID=A0A851GJG2_9BACT|nr:hypothetical protein [Oceaniferula marina]NWK57653.1 hypothetical protein [Oceaniferula marina]